MFKIEKKEHYDFDFEFWTFVIGMVVLVTGTVILCILGAWGYDGGDELNTYHHPPIGQCLYIGLPILWGFILCIGGLFFIEYPYETPIFRKKGFVWDKLPYAIWGMISCIECLVFGISRIIFSYILIWIIPYYCSLYGYKFVGKALRTIYVAFTTPDGKAESRIHAIWATQQEKECVKEGDKGESV